MGQIASPQTMNTINTAVDDVSKLVTRYITHVDHIDMQIANRSRFRDAFFNIYSCKTVPTKSRTECVKTKLIKHCNQITVGEVSNYDAFLHLTCVKHHASQARMATMINL